MFLDLGSARNQIVVAGRQEPVVFLVLIPLSFLVAGPWRGTLTQGLLRESFNPAQAISLANFIFAIVYVFPLQGDDKIVHISGVFLLALTLSAVYELTDNLVVPVSVHGTYNLLQFGLAYGTVTYGIDYLDSSEPFGT